LPKLKLYLCMVVLLLVATNTLGASLDTTKVHKHFEWGEYDSLLLKVPSLLAESSLVSLELKATYLQYLGSAYFSGGDTLRAKECYTQAYALNPQVVVNTKFMEESASQFWGRVRAALDSVESVRADSTAQAAVIVVQLEEMFP